MDPFDGLTMLRLARLDAPGTLHHVIIRGIEKRKIVKMTKKVELISSIVWGRWLSSTAQRSMLVQEYGIPSLEIARYLGVSTSAIFKVVKSHAQ